MTTALAELIEQQGAVGFEVAGKRLDMGTPLGYIKTQVELAMHGVFAKEFTSFLRSLRS